MVDTFRILTLNNIAQVGLKRFPVSRYEVGSNVRSPHAILVRSHDMHAMEIPAELHAVARAGVGTDNIPVQRMNTLGVPVFNAPGANANAVKELVIASLLLAARNILPAARFAAELTGDGDEAIGRKVEAEKEHYAGVELINRTLGIIGLGKVGSAVADAAMKLGMHVVGYDPHISVDAAWNIPAPVKKAQSLEEVLKAGDFITVHVPLMDATRDLISHERIELFKHQATLLNFSRESH
jgi:D-3-phosphoglycerate dehydrogenase / 2-oxoglutarate reductase